MRSKVGRIQQILGIPSCRLPSPRILITMDLGEEEYHDGTGPAALDLLARHRIPLTLFVNNRSDRGGDNRRFIAGIESFCRGNGIPLEIASHATNHQDLRFMKLADVASRVEESLCEFRDWGIPARGFRAPYLGTEGFYQELLAHISEKGGTLVYDSSLFFEANLATSLFHAVTRKKSPHKIGRVWELPISCLDDYHLIKRGNSGAAFAYRYWTAEARLWIRSINYFLVLFHPYVIGNHLEVLDRFLCYCKRCFPEEAFCRCTDVVDELESSFSVT